MISPQLSHALQTRRDRLLDDADHLKRRTHVRWAVLCRHYFEAAVRQLEERFRSRRRRPAAHYAEPGPAFRPCPGRHMLLTQNNYARACQHQLLGGQVITQYQLLQGAGTGAVNSGTVVS